MKTNLPDTIATWEQAKSFLKELHGNDEYYHPEDDAFGVIWNTCSPTDEEKSKLNSLMDEIYLLPEMKNYPDVEQCPCGFLLDLDRTNIHFV